MSAFRSVRGVIIGTAVFFLLVTLGARGVALWDEYHDALRRAQATTGDVAAVIEQYAKRTFETSDLIIDQALSIIRESGGLDRIGERQETQQALSRLAEKVPTSGNLWVVGSDGRPILMSDRFPAAPVDLADREWFRAHLAGEQRYVGPAIIGRVNHEPLFTYSRSIVTPQGTVRAIVLITLRPVFFNDSLFPPAYRPGAVLGMYQRDGDIVARSPFRAEMIGSSMREAPSFERFATLSGGMHRSFSPLDGRERIVSFKRVEDWPVVVAASVAWSDVMSGFWEQVIWSAALLSAILVALAWLVWLGLNVALAEEQTRAALTQAVAQRDILFQEIHHRIKNNLATVTSLLALQARKLDSPDAKAAFDETRERIASIGLVHETLYQTGNAEEVQLAEYLTRLVDGLAAAYGASQRGIAIRTDMDDCTVDLRRAIPIALTINEAVSNAFKHAFADEAGGEITVALECEGDHLEFQVRDTGRGMPETVSSSSLGLRLVRSFAAQVEGTVSFRNAGGTVFELLVPKSPQPL